MQAQYRTPLHPNTVNNEIKAMQFLADGGRSVLVRDKDGWLASDWAQAGLTPGTLILLRKIFKVIFPVVIWIATELSTFRSIL